VMQSERSISAINHNLSAACSAHLLEYVFGW
jgi:hypothetical protein